MPGIVGIISQRGDSSDPGAVQSMIDAMRHESFHVTSHLSFSGSGLELGIVDGGAVSHVAAGGVTVVVSGKGYFGDDPAVAYRREAFAERLVRRYRESGSEGLFRESCGVFTGVLVDEGRGRVFLFNDRFGFERLYLRERDGGILFASEANAILAVAPDSRGFHGKGLVEYLALGTTIDGHSLFRGIELLEGGAIWCWEKGEVERRRYFSPAEWEGQDPLSPADFQEAFETTFREIVPRYTESEGPIGISLTGGLDTRMLMSTLPDLAEPPVCYTYTAADREVRDARTARRVAEALGLRHENLRVEDDFFRDFGNLVDRTVLATDGYFGTTGAHEIYLNAKGREISPVRLTGVFGGEVMCDISTFKPVRLHPGLLNPDLLDQVRRVEGEFQRREMHPLTFAAFQEIPWKMYGTIAACRSQVEFRTPYLDDRLVRLFYRMPTDSFDNRRSAEILIRHLHPGLAGIPTDMGALGNRIPPHRWLAKAWAYFTFKLDYYGNEGMPHRLSWSDPIIEGIGIRSGLVGQHKYLHYRRWLRGRLAGFLRERMSDSSVTESPIWNQKRIAAMAEEHISGRCNWETEINSVLTLASVERQLFGSGTTSEVNRGSAAAMSVSA